MLYLLNSITFGISRSTNFVQPLKAEFSIVDTMGSLHEVNSCLLKNAFSGTVIVFGKQTCVITFENLALSQRMLIHIQALHFLQYYNWKNSLQTLI